MFFLPRRWNGMTHHSLSHHPLILTDECIELWWSQSRNKSPHNSINISISNVKLAIQKESFDCVSTDSVLRYVNQLQLAASLIAIPSSKPAIGNKSRRAIITEVIPLDVTFVTFTDATISENFTRWSIELNLKMRCFAAEGKVVHDRVLMGCLLLVQHVFLALCILHHLC